MADFDGAAFGKEVVAEVKRYLKDQTDPLVQRLEGLEKRVSEVANVDIKSIIGDAVATVLPKAINDALAGVDQRIAAVTLERSAFVDMIDQAVGAVHEKLREVEEARTAGAAEFTKQLAEITAGFADSIASLTVVDKQFEETFSEAFDGVQQTLVGINDDLAKRYDELEAKVADLPVEAVKGEAGPGIIDIQLATDGMLQVKLTGDQYFRDLGIVRGNDGRDGIDGQNGEKGADFELDWAARYISDAVTQAVKELPVPVSITDIRLIEGQLSLTMSDGKNYDIGQVVGRDGVDGKDGTNGIDGKDVDRAELMQWVSTELNAEAEKILEQIVVPEPVSIKSAHISDDGDLWLEIGVGGHVNLGKVKADEVDMGYLEGVIQERVGTVVNELLPSVAGKDGRDGIDGKDAIVDADLLKQLVFEEVAVQVDHIELPKPENGKDGLGIKGAEVTEQGFLRLLLTDDQSITISTDIRGANGKDVDMEVVQNHVAGLLEAWPKPEDGKDGRDGIDGKDGANGRDGAGFKSAHIDDDGNLVLLDLNADPIRVGNVKGANGRDGKDVNMSEVEELVKAEVATIPRPENGIDGKSITVEDVTPLLTELVEKSVAKIPVPIDGKDGVGLGGAFIDRDGELVVTLTNGEAKKLGPVMGRDGKDVDPEEVKALVKKEVDAIPRPRDGVDGVGFDDMDVVYDEDHKEVIISAAKGDNAQQWKFFLPMVVDMGVFKDGTEYLRGDGTTFGGSFWIAQEKTSDKPGTTAAWRLAVKKGRDGKDRPVEPKAAPTSIPLEK